MIRISNLGKVYANVKVRIAALRDVTLDFEDGVLAAGTYPDMRAARVDPVRTLRHDQSIDRFDLFPKSSV